MNRAGVREAHETIGCLLDQVVAAVVEHPAITLADFEPEVKMQRDGAVVSVRVRSTFDRRRRPEVFSEYAEDAASACAKLVERLDMWIEVHGWRKS